ncbi:MAG: O-antigen ligase family protein, partial [Alphaproteobacteria bacterium]|nr:O-antigen ligase family protein [Alphaproteobacteria bacterium]
MISTAQPVGYASVEPTASRSADLGKAATLSELGLGGVLVVAYLVMTRIGYLPAAKIGVQIGPVPLFLTEIFILAMGAVALVTRSAPLVVWLASGGLARAPGFMLWLLFVVSIVYTAAAFGDWGILAVRDFAIFGYGVIFALVYIVLDTREKAAAAMRWFTYSAIVLALLLIADTVSGAHVLFLPEVRFVTEAQVAATSYGGGDVGGIISFSLVALLAYAAVSPERRALHLAAAAVCFYAVMVTQTRSAVLGLGLATLYSLFGMSTTQRLSFLALGVGAVIAFFVVPVLAPDSGLAHSILSFSAAVRGGIGGAHDQNVIFRLLRWDRVFELWREHPIFGVGFGQPLVPKSLIAADENGAFNAGLPHNTYLTVLARLGLFGLVLIMGAWITSIALATKAIRRPNFGGDAFAAGAALVAMMGFAPFVLFL